jgi:hypothetical protein
MTELLLQAHSVWRWVVLIVIIFVVVRALIGWLAKQKWTSFETSLMRYSRFIMYVQVVLGILLFIVLQRWALGFGFVGSHVIPALLAVGGVEFGAARARKSRGSKKFMFAFIGFAIALLMIYGSLAAVGAAFI